MKQQLRTFIVLAFLLHVTADAHNEVYSPIPNFRVELVNVVPGQYVERGANLMVLDLMKMRYTISAGQSGVIDRINVQAGQVLNEFQDPLLIIKYLLVDIADKTSD